MEAREKHMEMQEEAVNLYWVEGVAYQSGYLSVVRLKPLWASCNSS